MKSEALISVDEYLRTAYSPDCDYVRDPKEQIFRTPPFICIEVLSPEDRRARFQQRIDDYLAFGVQYIWVVDPATHRAWVHAKDGVREAKDGMLTTENPALTVSLAEVFAGLDE